MTRRAAELLARLERHALDEQRLVLAGLQAELEGRRAEIAKLERQLVEEHAVGWLLPGGPRLLAAYATASHARQCSLRAAEHQLAEAAKQARGEVAARMRRFKSLDLAAAAERRREAEAEAEACKERLEIEEAGALRAAAVDQNSGANVTSSPSRAAPNLIWQDSRELSRTSNASSSIMPSSELAASSRPSHASST
jgi:hypothetical protein